MKPLKPNQQRARNAMILLGIMLGLELASLGSAYLLYNALQDVANGIEISPEDASAHDNRQKTITILFIIANVLCVVTFILWFRRAYYNLHQKVTTLAAPESWAAFSWFIPIVCLVRPYKIMTEMYRETRQLLVERDIYFRGDLSTGYVGAWWTLWILNGAFGVYMLRYGRNTETIEEAITAIQASMVINVVGIPLALLAIKVIKDYSDVEPLLLDVKGDGDAPAPVTISI